MNKEDLIFVAGARGMVGSSLIRHLHAQGYQNLLSPYREELDLLDQRAVRGFLQKNRPDVVVIAAAKVGGIYANMTYPADFLYQNLMIACNLIHEAHLANVNRLLFLGSTCIYPRLAEQPIVEEALLSAPLEKTNEAYALAKISGIKMCSFYRNQFGRDYISAMPTNLYGPNDSYHPENSHVIPGLIRRFHEAKEKNLSEVTIWGSGTPKREFLFVDDLADACLFLLKNYHSDLHINVGTDEEMTIKETAESVADVVGFHGKIVSDLTKPDGTMRKKTDLTRISALGWQAKTPFKEGLKIAYSDFSSRLVTF